MDQLEPMELPVHVLTSDMVDAAAMAPEPPTSAETHPAEADLIAAVAAIKARGNELYADGRFDEALAAYSEALTLDDTNGPLWGNRAAAHLELGRPVEAFADASKMAALLPDKPKSHFRLGQAFEALGKAGGGRGMGEGGSASGT